MKSLFAFMVAALSLAPVVAGAQADHAASKRPGKVEDCAGQTGHNFGPCKGWKHVSDQFQSPGGDGGTGAAASSESGSAGSAGATGGASGAAGGAAGSCGPR